MWTLQDAKNRFSAVVEAALAGTPQEVTRRGKPAVVVVADECWCADALTKVVSLMESASSPVLRMFNATAALLDAHGTLRAMPGFMERLGHATPEEQSSHA